MKTKAIPEICMWSSQNNSYYLFSHIIHGTYTEIHSNYHLQSLVIEKV